MTYAILNGTAWTLYKLSSGRIAPHDYQTADPWSVTNSNGFMPGWVRRLSQGKRDFWKDSDSDNELDMEHTESKIGAKCIGGDDASRASDEHSHGIGATNEFAANWEMPPLTPTQTVMGSRETIVEISVERTRRCTQ